MCWMIQLATDLMPSLFRAPWSWNDWVLQWLMFDAFRMHWMPISKWGVKWDFHFVLVPSHLSEDSSFILSKRNTVFRVSALNHDEWHWKKRKNYGDFFCKTDASGVAMVRKKHWRTHCYSVWSLRFSLLIWNKNVEILSDLKKVQ